MSSQVRQSKPGAVRGSAAELNRRVRAFAADASDAELIALLRACLDGAHVNATTGSMLWLGRAGGLTAARNDIAFQRLFRGSTRRKSPAYARSAALTEPRIAVAVEPGADGLVVTDDEGRLFARIGLHRLEHTQIDTLQADVDALKSGMEPTDWPELRAVTEMVHIIAYGQSMSLGQGGVPALTSAALPYAVSFAGGVRFEDSPAPYRAFVPFTEQDSTSVYHAGETPLGGCFEMIAQLLIAEDGVDLSTANQRLLGSAPGHTGHSLPYFSQGNASGYFERVESDIANGAALSRAEALSYAVGAVIWLQGEADCCEGTAQSTYQAMLRQMRADVEATARAQSGVRRPLPLLTYQTATHRFYRRTSPDIALAQLALTAEPYFAMASPTYFLPFFDQEHLTNLGYKHLGAYFGLGLKRWLWDGIKPSPLAALPPIRAGAKILVPFDLPPGRRLTLDTATVPDPGHYGFSLAASDGSDLPLTSVALVGRRALCVTAASAAPPDVQLRYGWIGDSSRGFGCVRDDAGEELVFDPDGLALRMHNWLPICSLHVA